MLPGVSAFVCSLPRALAVVAAVAVLVSTANPAVAAAPADGGPGFAATDDCEELLAGEPEPDPGGDVLGWENGCWADASLAVSRDDGLNETERRAVFSRAMARVESVRRLEFEENVTLGIRPASNWTVASDYPESHDYTYEALLVVGEDEGYGDLVGAQPPPGYSTSSGVVVLVEDVDEPQIPEWLLAHELAHVLQNQHFVEDRSRFFDQRLDERLATPSIGEGEAQYVQHRYERRCYDEWECGRLTRGPFGDTHPSLLALSAFPYMDGMAFVDAVRQRGGWSAVDALHRDGPASTEQVIHPDRYPEDSPATGEVVVSARPSGDWERASIAGKPSDTVGEAGIFVMFATPAWENATAGAVIDRRRFVAQYDERPVSFDPYNYSHRFSDGWAGDRLVVYESPEAGANETAYVWKLQWETERDAREFVEGYERLLRVRGASAVPGSEHTFRVPDDRRFGDAFRVTRRGTTVVVVNAPSESALLTVHPEQPATSTTTTSGPDGNATTAAGGATTTPTGTESAGATSSTTPGVGLLGAAVSVAAATVLARRL